MRFGLSHLGEAFDAYLPTLGSPASGRVLMLEVVLPLAMFVLGFGSALLVRWFDQRLQANARRDERSVRFEQERLVELLELAATWHAHISNEYWRSVETRERAGGATADIGIRRMGPIRKDVDRIWIELRAATLLLGDADLQDDVDRMRDAGIEVLEAAPNSDATSAYQREIDAYFDVTRRIGQSLSTGHRR